MITERWETLAHGHHSDGTHPSTGVSIEYPAGNAWHPLAWGRLHIHVRMTPDRVRCLARDGSWVDLNPNEAIPADGGPDLGFPVPPGFLEAVHAIRGPMVEHLQSQVKALDQRAARAEEDADRYRMLADTAARTVEGMRLFLHMGEAAAELDGPPAERRTLEAVIDDGR